MRLAAVLIAAALTTWAASSPRPPAVSQAEYKHRRQALRLAEPAAMILLMGASDDAEGDLRTGFFQEPNFLYLTGWTEPGAILLLTAGAETLFLPHHNPKRENFTGRFLSAEDPGALEKTGIERVLPIEKLESEIAKALDSAPKVMALTNPSTLLKAQRLISTRPIEDAQPAIAELRMRKSPAEIALIQYSTAVTLQAHRAAWKRMSAGLYEYQIATTMVTNYLEQGCERSAYAPIVGSGPNGAVLHYSANSRRMDAGEVVVMDVAAECGGYSSDITRTVPVNGHFSPRQRELYDIVLGAQKAAVAALKPGVTLAKNQPDSLYKVAYDYIDSHGKDLHGASLGKYFTHGLGHHVGLDVHDASNPATRMEAGMVVTMEPGIYIPEENIGIRIEDIVLVTATGGQVLSASLPREPDEIEKALASRE